MRFLSGLNTVNSQDIPGAQKNTTFEIVGKIFEFLKTL